MDRSGTAVAGIGSGSTNFFNGGVFVTLPSAESAPKPDRFASAEEASNGAAIKPALPPTTAVRSRARRLTPLPVGSSPARGESFESRPTTSPFGESFYGG